MNKLLLAIIPMLIILAGCSSGIGGEDTVPAQPQPDQNTGGEDTTGEQNEDTTPEENDTQQDDTQQQEDEQQTQPSTDSEEVDREIVIDAFNYGYSQETITVEQGERVRVEMISADGLHDFVIDELGVESEQIDTGATTTFEFVADETGEFDFYCSVGNHRAQGMEGTLIVE